MIRKTVSRLAAAALLASLIAATGAQAQSKTVELDQSLLDQWIVAMPAVIKLGKSPSAPQTDEAARPHVERICTEAGFQSYDQCAEVIGCIGMIISACDRRTQTFRDPIPLMRREIARLEADTKMPAAAKAQAIAEMEEILATFPDGFPDHHIRLMNANRNRVFAAVFAPKE
ncbi:MAG: hypothetical protein WBD27_20200 [Pyrinomonadaceae bacterium]